MVGFFQVDPFNPQNILEGYISRQLDEYYGALLITKINGEDTHQEILCTPKIKYPFNKKGDWIMPPISWAEIYEKIDGTNIFMYRYMYKGDYYVTYKTRLSPFVKNNSFGDLLDLWRQVLSMYQDIPLLFTYNPDIIGFSFEMYGELNPHLIKYKAEGINATDYVQIDTMLLFGLNKNNNVVTNRGIEINDVVDKAALIEFLYKDEHFETKYVQNVYKKRQQELEEFLDKTDDGMYEGDEGEIFYVRLKDSDIITMFKCKPETIEKIHFANCALSIESNVIKATIIKAFESFSNVDYDVVEKLLLEDYSIDRVSTSADKIKHALKEELELRQIGSIVKNKLQDQDIETIPDKMRFLSKYFDKKDITKVYQVVKRQTT